MYYFGPKVHNYRARYHRSVDQLSVMPNAIRADRASLTSDDRATYTVTHKHVPIDTRQDPVNETPRFTSPTAQPYLRFRAGRRLEKALDEILTVLPRAVKGTMCPCRTQVNKAIAVVRRARVCRFDASSYTYSAFQAVRRVLGGYMVESALCSALGVYERRATECRVAAAIGNAQDVVYEMMITYQRRNHCRAVG